MGFFRLLTRKAPTDRNQQIKNQAYNSTVASVPPIQGTYPVAGNGPNVLDKLQQAERKRSQAHLSVVNHDIHIDPTEPPPMIPRFRGFSPGRPTTAPNHANSLTSRSRSVFRSVRSTNSASSVPEKSQVRSKGPPPVPSIPSHHRHEDSFDSFQDKRFVDILDAQGEIKPSSFRSRIIASGAREFGEDVAERNIGGNDLNLSGPAFKAFCRLSSSGRLTLQTSSSGGLSFHDYDAVEKDECAPPPGVPHGDLGTIRESYSRPSSSSTWRSFSGSIGSDMLRLSKFQGRVERRPETQASLDPAMKATTLQNRRTSFNAFASTLEPERSKPRPLSQHPSVSNLHYAPSSPPPSPRSRPNTSQGRSRRRSIGRVEIENAVDEAFDTPAPCPTIPVRFKQTEHRQSRPKSYHSRLDTHNARSSSSSSIDKPYGRARSNGGSSLLRHERFDDVTKHIPIPISSLTLQSQPCITPTTGSSGYSNNPFLIGPDQHAPSTSIDASLPPPIKLSQSHEREQSGGVASLGNQSACCTAAEDDFSTDTHVPSYTELEKDLSLPANGLDLDYYISDASEDSVDSFIASKAQLRDEEGLLFKLDYGVAGDGLLGLLEPLPIPKSPPPPETRSIKALKTPKSPKRPRQLKNNKSTTSRKSRHETSRSSQRSNFSSPRRHKHRHGSSSNDEDSNSFWEMHYESSHEPGFVSFAELGIDLQHLGLDQYGLTREDDAKVDTGIAMKLRKKMKRKMMETQSRRKSQLYVGRGGDERYTAAH